MNDETKVREAVSTIIDLLTPLEWEARAQILAASSTVAGCYETAQQILALLVEAKRENLLDGINAGGAPEGPDE